MAGTEDKALLYARDELINNILQEEDELIAAHKLEIEETMTLVRSEMNLVAQVGSHPTQLMVHFLYSTVVYSTVLLGDETGCPGRFRPQPADGTCPVQYYCVQCCSALR